MSSEFKLDESVSCAKCASHRIGTVSGKCSDLSDFSLGNISKDGYLPSDIGIGGGDYIEFSYCLDCGTIEGTFPLPPTEIEVGEDEEDEDYE